MGGPATTGCSASPAPSPSTAPGHASRALPRAAVTSARLTWQRARHLAAAFGFERHYGGALYQCRDLEGNLWSFGSYDPWVSPS